MVYISKHQFIPPTKKTYPIIVSTLHTLFHFYPHNNLMRQETVIPVIFTNKKTKLAEFTKLLNGESKT